MTTCRSTLPTLNQRLSPLSTTSFRDAVLYTTEWSVVVLGIDFGYLLLVFTKYSAFESQFVRDCIYGVKKVRGIRFIYGGFCWLVRWSVVRPVLDLRSVKPEYILIFFKKKVRGMYVLRDKRQGQI